MRAEIYRQLKALDFNEDEATEMSAEFVLLLKSLGIATAKMAGSVGRALAVSLLHSWMLALII